MLKGFRFGAVAAEIKYKDRLDLTLIASDKPAAAVAKYTGNSVQAAPVILSTERTAGNRLQAVVVNAGNANACTGQQGLADARKMTQLAAAGLGIDENLIAVCSTGVIGRPMPMDRVEAAFPGLLAKLDPNGADDAARAIMTTDTAPKKIELEMDLDGTKATLVGLAKGSGMIHPNMATMLVFLLTDAAVGPHAMNEALSDAMPHSFHGMSVDGDTSTNDSLIFMANGAAGNEEIKDFASPGGAAFYAAVDRACRELADMILDDAEGGTKVVTIDVRGAGSEMEADMVAIAIACSPLCKTAFFGADPNWGRIICAAGYSGARVETDKVDIYINEAHVCNKGLDGGEAELAKAEAAMKEPRFTVRIDLDQGPFDRIFKTTDLSYDYVKINADYTT